MEGTSSQVFTQQRSRIETVDALRGFAVFGILLSHCYYLFFLGRATNETSLDQGVTIFIQLFVNNKFYTLFSFLFGLGFALMLSRRHEKEQTFLRIYAWRLFLLGVIGVLHTLHWNDDILSIYALLGFFLLALYKLNNKLLLLLAILLLLNVPGLIYTEVKSEPAKPELEQVEQQAIRVYEQFLTSMKSGTYVDTVKANIQVFPYKVTYYMESGRFMYIFAFFLFGPNCREKTTV